MSKLHPFDISFQTTPAERMQSLHDYFRDVPVRVDEVVYFALLIVVVGIVLALIKLGVNIVRKKRLDYQFLAVSSHSGIEALLHELFLSGDRIDFRFTDTNGTARQGDGTIIHLDARKLVLEWITSATDAKAWDGQNLECYFRTWQNKSMRHNIFTVPIKKAAFMGGERVHIEIPLPEIIESRQKRATLRIMPPGDSVLSMAIWGIIGTGLPPDAGKLGVPAMVYFTKETSQFSLDNLSAGGVRLRIPYDKKESFPARIKNGSLFYFSITLRRHSENANISYWMLCRVQVARSVPRLQSFMLGCQFLAYAQQTDEFPGLLRWKKLENNTEILSLSNWIFRSHLDIYRKKGIDISR